MCFEACLAGHPIELSIRKSQASLSRLGRAPILRNPSMVPHSRKPSTDLKPPCFRMMAKALEFGIYAMNTIC